MKRWTFFGTQCSLVSAVQLKFKT